jgi:hypothetical protein
MSSANGGNGSLYGQSQCDIEEMQDANLNEELSHLLYE